MRVAVAALALASWAAGAAAAGGGAIDFMAVDGGSAPAQQCFNLT